MFQNIIMWNLSNPDKEMLEYIKEVEFRGYNPKKNLTSQFANKISEGVINPLSVGNIADEYCSKRRDLYYKKGSNSVYRKRGTKKWGRIAGIFSHLYLSSLFTKYVDKKIVTNNYNSIIKTIDKFSSKFVKENEAKFQELDRLASKEYEDSNCLLKILKIDGRMEIVIKKILSFFLPEGKYMNPSDLSIECKNKKIEFYPNPIEVGINRPSTPDFFIEKFKIVGDIKTGIFFDERYLLTCAGYAIAYENWKKEEKMDINWGMIYFLPNRIPTDFAKPITYAQLYIFPIDDILRGWFLKERDRAYRIISKDCPPDFPEDKEDKEKCEDCKYNKVCMEMGLTI